LVIVKQSEACMKQFMSFSNMKISWCVHFCMSSVCVINIRVIGLDFKKGVFISLAWPSF